MKATPELRFVERYVPAPEIGSNISRAVRILQQWWEHGPIIGDNNEVITEGEWRDVPLAVDTPSEERSHE